MRERSYVVLAKKLWNEAADEQELKQNIGNYMSVAYPGYRVIEIGKHYAICEFER